jgi:hypothetical protein
MLTYDTVDPDLPEMIRIKLQTLQAQKNQLLHPTEELKNTGKTIIKGNYIWRPSSHNQSEYEMLRLCAEAGFDKVPRYYETREDLDRFDYMKGSTIGDAKNREQHFSQIMRFMGQFHETTMTGNGKIYVHGGIGDDNVILDKDGIKAVINWQNCREGDRYEDIVSLLLDWLHIGDLAWSRYEPETFGQVIVSGLSAYGADSEFCSQLIIRIQAELERRMEKLKQEKDSYNYKSRYVYLRNAEIFLELYGEQIRSIREEI